MFHPIAQHHIMHNYKCDGVTVQYVDIQMTNGWLWITSTWNQCRHLSRAYLPNTLVFKKIIWKVAPWDLLRYTMSSMSSSTSVLFEQLFHSSFNYAHISAESWNGMNVCHSKKTISTVLNCVKKPLWTSSSSQTKTTYDLWWGLTEYGSTRQ